MSAFVYVVVLSAALFVAIKFFIKKLKNNLFTESSKAIEISTWFWGGITLLAYFFKEWDLAKFIVNPFYKFLINDLVELGIIIALMGGFLIITAFKLGNDFFLKN